MIFLQVCCEIVIWQELNHSCSIEYHLNCDQIIKSRIFIIISCILYNYARKCTLINFPIKHIDKRKEQQIHPIHIFRIQKPLIEYSSTFIFHSCQYNCIFVRNVHSLACSRPIVPQLYNKIVLIEFSAFLIRWIVRLANVE